MALSRRMIASSVYQARQVVEHQLGHLVGQLVADPGVADQDIVDRHRRHVLLLAVVGAGGNARGVVGRAVDLRHHVRRDRDEGDRHGRGQVAAAPAAAGGDDAILSPAARKLAEEAGIDPNSIAGTGKGGRVTKEDVVAAVEAKKNAPAAPAKPAAPAAEAPIFAAGDSQPRRICSARKTRLRRDQTLMCDISHRA